MPPPPVLNGLDDRIRTCDFRVPSAALYQAELHPDEIGEHDGILTRMERGGRTHIAFLGPLPLPLATDRFRHALV